MDSKNLAHPVHHSVHLVPQGYSLNSQGSWLLLKRYYLYQIIFCFPLHIKNLHYSSDFWYDSRLRCDVVDLYFKLYGRKRPHAVPIAELAMLNKATKVKTENTEAKVSCTLKQKIICSIVLFSPKKLFLRGKKVPNRLKNHILPGKASQFFPQKSQLT